MNRRLFTILSCIFLGVSTGPTRAGDQPITKEQRVRDYVAAFNKQELETMLSMVTDDIQWLSVEADKITVETRGKAKLRESMTAYFKRVPSAKSELDWVTGTKARVVAQERATWQGRSGPKFQTSLSIYEFQDGLIARVYYYPAEH